MITVVFELTPVFCSTLLERMTPSIARFSGWSETMLTCWGKPRRPCRRGTTRWWDEALCVSVDQHLKAVSWPSLERYKEKCPPNREFHRCILNSQSPSTPVFLLPEFYCFKDWDLNLTSKPDSELGLRLFVMLAVNCPLSAWVFPPLAGRHRIDTSVLTVAVLQKLYTSLVAWVCWSTWRFVDVWFLAEVAYQITVFEINHAFSATIMGQKHIFSESPIDASYFPKLCKCSLYAGVSIHVSVSLNEDIIHRDIIIDCKIVVHILHTHDYMKCKWHAYILMHS